MTGSAREKPHAGRISADGRGQRLTEECSDQRKPKRLQHRELGSAPLRDDLPARGGQGDLNDERRLRGDNFSRDILDLGAAYAREYNEVKQVGDARVRGALPDSEESDIARFWPGGGSNWNLTTREIVSGMSLDRWQHARLFALLNLAQADALIFGRVTYEMMG